jgi:hypothetical protein
VIIGTMAVCCVFVIIFNILTTIVIHVREKQKSDISDSTTASTDEVYQPSSHPYHIYAPVKLENAIVFYVSYANYRLVKKMISCMQHDETKYMLAIGTNIDFGIQNEIESFLRVQYVRFPAHEFANLTSGGGDWQIRNFVQFQSALSKFASNYVSTLTNEPHEFEPKTLAKRFAITNQDFLICMTDKKKPELKYKKLGIVIPFIQQQTQSLLNQLDRWQENAFLACDKSYISDPSKLQVEILFYYHKSREEQLEDMIQERMKAINHCFSNVFFRYAYLNEDQDKYPWGPNHMFFRMIHAPDMYLHYQYALYAEPDLFAIRPNWIEYLTTVIKNSVRPFWILGSIYRGKSRTLGNIYYNIHLNGNAIYNVANSEFRHFLFEVSKRTNREAYDVAISKYLFEDLPRLRQYWHYILFFYLIFNIFDREWKLRQTLFDYPSTYFVHGRMNDINKITTKTSSDTKDNN